MISPLASPFRGGWRNVTPMRARGRGGQNPWTPVALAPYAWYDVHVGSTSSTIADTSGNGRADATYGATTAAPLYLPFTGTAYLHLEAATSGTNSLSCTAPANTASYAAYPLGGGAATTGAASSGAFTFTTAGDWTQVDLLDGSAVVLASFRPSDSGQTGHTDAYSVAWTINRGTAGGKSTLVNRRSMALLRTNDEIDISAAAIPPLGTSDTATFVVVARVWDTQVSLGRLFSTESAGNDGFYLATSITRQPRSAFGSGSSTTNAISVTTPTNGQLVAYYGSMAARTATGLSISWNAAAETTSDISAQGAHAIVSGKVGRRPYSAISYQDFEFYALITLNRSLTAGERTLINTYYGVS